MKEVTIISYPTARDDSLLSLTENQSRYMIPIGGRFRVIDFTLRNSFSSGALKTIIYNNKDDNLQEYVNKYGPFNEKFPPIKVVSRNYSDIKVCYNMILDSNTDYYVIYNGDYPSLLDFDDLIRRYRKRKSGAMLFLLKINGKPSMAHKVLIANQKSLLKIINEAMDEARESPNIFEMIINSMIHKGIGKGGFDGYIWPINHIPDYYRLNREIIWNDRIFSLLYRDKIIQSQIKTEGYAHLGPKSSVRNSFISDFCTINGTVENSIIYPGVEIKEDAQIRDSIILPFVKIGRNSRIVKTIIDERTDLDPESDYLNIEEICKVGTTEQHIKNNDFPKALFESITLIGKDCRIAQGASIGGGCFVSSSQGHQFADKKFLYNGSSLVK